MDAAPQADLNRMVLSIEYEAEAKIKELRIQSIQMYNTLKAEYIENKSKAVVAEYHERAQKALQDRARKEGALRNAFKKKIQAVKQQMLEKVFCEAERILRKKRLDPTLIEECLERVGKGSLSQFYIFVASRDEDALNSFFKGAADSKRLTSSMSDLRKLRSMSKEMPESGLGGVIFFSKDGRNICDNSFRIRLDIFKEKYLHTIIKDILG